MIKVLIADDQAMVRQGFGALLAAQPDMRGGRRRRGRRGGGRRGPPAATRTSC